MHADKLAPAVVAAVAVVCLLFLGRAHGQDEYVPAAASQQVQKPVATYQNTKFVPQPEVMPVQKPVATYQDKKFVPQPEVTPVQKPVATYQNRKFLPQPEVMPVPAHLFRWPGLAVFAPQKGKETTQPAATHTSVEGALRSTYSYLPGESTPTPAEQEEEAEAEAETTTEPEPATTTAPGQGDFYRSGQTPTKPVPAATPTKPKPPATPSSPASDEQSPYSGGGGGSDNKQVDDDGEPVDGLSTKAITNIIKEHNMFRARERVPPLTWNATVAQYAQQYANKRKGDCEMKHSQGGPYGENLMWGEGKAWTWRHTVDEWSNEKKNYHYGPNSCDAGKMCGHYTAVVWKDTSAVGCGRITCINGNTLMVCSYYPPGNYDGEKPY